MNTAFKYLRVKYPENECIILSEVADSSSRNRYLDYMVINLWESRGQSIIGFEVKSYRGDWLNELKKPQKQELHAPYCDYFYLLTMDEKIAKEEEIPDNWGWMTVRGDKLFILKKAPKQEAKPIPKRMMVGMLRRAADKSKYVHIDTIQDKIKEEVDLKIEQNKRHRDWELERYENLKKDVADFEESSGISIKGGWRGGKESGAAVNFFIKNSPENIQERLESIKKSAEYLYNQAKEGIEIFKKVQDEKDENNI